MRKRQFLTSIAGAVFLSAAAAMSVFAAGWVTGADGQWNYLENDGTKATDAWRKDSSGNWFYLDGSGNIVTNRLIDDT